MTETTSVADPFDPDLIENPWNFFAQLRAHHPVYRLPNGAYSIVSRYEDVMKVVMDTETYSSNLVAVLMSDEGAEGEPEMMTLSGGDGRQAQATDVLAIADPPIHTRQRRVANRAFTMRRVAAMEDGIRLLCEQLIDQFGAGSVDWVKQLAVPLPMTIIIRLLGFPLADMPQLKVWSDASVALLSGINSTEELIEHGSKINELIAYLAARYDEAFENPGDNVLGDLVREAKIDAEEFGRDEIVSMLVQLLSAGNETTASLIGSAMMLLVQDPDLQSELRQSPDKIGNFIEETLRLEAPFHGHFRVVTQDTTLAGATLKKGERLMLSWSSSGRDEAKFDHAQTVDLQRKAPKSHLSFGYGIHHCIGASLARSEARIAIETILARTSAISLVPGSELKHIPSLFIRSLQRLDIQRQS